MMSFKQTTLESWVEWKDKCALARCGAVTQADLQEWAVPIFLNRLRKANVSDSLLHRMSVITGTGISMAWHYLEVHYYCISIQKGVRWKDWLSAGVKRSPDNNPRASFERLTQVRILQVSTDLQRDDQKSERWTEYSLDKPIDEDKPTGLTRGEITQTEGEFAPDAQTAWQEVCDIAEREAEAAWHQLLPREAVALGCTFASIHISPNREKILPHAGCGWTQFNLAIKTAKDKCPTIITEAAHKYAESDPSDLKFFTNLFQQSFRSCCIEKLPPEIRGLERSLEQET